MLYNGKIIEYGDEHQFKNSSNPIINDFITGNSQGSINLMSK